MVKISNGFITVTFFPKEGEEFLAEEFVEGRALIYLEKGKARFFPHNKLVDVAVVLDKSVEEKYVEAFYKFWKEGKMAVGWDKQRRDFVTVPSVLELLGLS